MYFGQTRGGKARSHRWIAGLAVLLLAAGGVTYFLVIRTDPWVGPRRSDVLAVWIQPAPEGPPGFPFTRPGAEPWAVFATAGDLRLLLPFVPDPLPRPSRQWFCSGRGYSIHFLLVGGQGVNYGPCRRPASIDNVRTQMKNLWSAGGEST